MKQLLALFLTVTSLAATAGDNWTNTAGEPWRNSTGLCWRNANWTPATAHPDCDGALKPVPQVQAPAPAAAPVAVVKKEEPKQVVIMGRTFQAETLFDFDKAVIKPAGKKALDGLLDKLKDVNLEVIIVVGHTDWIGTEAYNMKLGARRAEAVKAYFISKGIDKTRVYTESKGETQPIASNKTAAGRAQNRRVEVELVGVVK